jgi:flagellar export protein FliJ
MAQFRFRLATLLRLRESLRDQRRLELAEAYRVDDLLRQQQEEVGRMIDSLRCRCREVAGRGQVDVDAMLAAQRYEAALRRQQQQLLAQREHVAGEIARRQEALAAASRDVKILEKLRQRQADAWQDEENSRAIKLLDEAAQRRAVLEDQP